MMTTMIHGGCARKTSTGCGAVLLCAAYLCLAATTCVASEFRYAVDEHPKQVRWNVWRFSVQVGAIPVGALDFACAQYDFATPTAGIAVDYDFDGAGNDFSDDRLFYGIAPTLFDQYSGFINGWDISDLGDGIFSGLVYARAPLTAVHFMIEADQFAPVRQPQRSPARGRRLR